MAGDGGVLQSVVATLNPMETVNREQLETFTKSVKADGNRNLWRAPGFHRAFSVRYYGFYKGF